MSADPAILPAETATLVVLTTSASALDRTIPAASISRERDRAERA